MPPPLGRVFWSGDAQNFYQEGRQGALSRLEGMQHLKARETATGVRYLDELNRFVPDPALLIPDSIRNEFLNVVRSADRVSDIAYTQAPGSDAYYATLFTYVDDNKKLNIGIQLFRVNRAIDPNLERSKISAQIASDLDIAPGTRGTPVIIKMAMARFHYRVT